MGVRDFFYPCVGLENRAGGHVFRFGVQVDRSFSWIADDWEVSMRYLPETLVSLCLAKSVRLGIELEVNDAVHSFLDLYFKKVVVKNVAERARGG